MAIPARTRLARLLAGDPPKTSQSATVHLSGDSLDLHVEGVGAVALPVRASIAKKLTAAASPAHFGRGEETLVDASVRDTGEIAPDRVTIAGDRWQASLADALEDLGTRLGVREPRRLRAELHSMLVYGKGQFFAPHQDSEKHDDMVATLVVMLPSTHTGGELVVSDQGQSKVYPGSRHELSLVAFYPDCRHEVLPVRSGHRVTLTFNVLLDELPDAEVVGPVDQAATLMREHFSTPVRRPYRSRDGDPPQRLAVLLDHEYSRRGLSANRLKGEDARRATLVKAAAKAAGYESVLAQAEIQETWNAEPTGSYYDSRDYYEGEDEESEDPDDYELGELLDGDTVLTWWADRESAGEISLALDDEEVCAATPSKLLTPYQSEYEGYMGNYGNTVDRWYRRAAVVIWPSEVGFGVRAEASPAWTLRTILGSLEAGQLERAREEARTLVSRWGTPGEALLAPALAAARGVGDAALAGELLAPFDVQLLGVEHAEPLASLVGVYPTSWWAALATQWDRRSVARDGSRGLDRRTWVESVLEPLCGRLTAADSPQVVEWLAAWMGDWVVTESRVHLGVAHATRRADGLERLGPALAAVLTVCDGEQATALAARIRELGDGALPMLLSALRSADSAALTTPALVSLAEHARARLQASLAEPRRSADDWSIPWESPGGDDADLLGTFLGSRTERTLAWPLAADRRRTIHHLIDDADLPVTHRTIRSGRPFTLLLEKTDAVFTREAAARRRAEDELAWLSAAVDPAAGASEA